MDEYNPNALVKGDRMFENAVIVVSCVCAAFVMVVLACMYHYGYKDGYSDGHRDGTLQTVSNIWNNVDIEVK